MDVLLLPRQPAQHRIDHRSETAIARIIAGGRHRQINGGAIWYDRDEDLRRGDMQQMAQGYCIFRQGPVDQLPDRGFDRAAIAQGSAEDGTDKRPVTIIERHILRMAAGVVGQTVKRRVFLDDGAEEARRTLPCGKAGTIFRIDVIFRFLFLSRMPVWCHAKRSCPYLRLMPIGLCGWRVTGPGIWPVFAWFIIINRRFGDIHAAVAPGGVCRNSSTMASSAAIRLSVLGWVENRLSAPRPLSGLMMNNGRGRRVALGIFIDDLLGAACDLVQGGSQPKRIAANLRSAPVGGIFAGAAYGHLHDHGGKRRNDHGDEDADETERVTVFAIAAAKEHGKIAEHRYGAGESGGNRHGKSIAVLDMGEFMRHDGSNFLGGQALQEPRAGCDGGVLGISAGGECIRLVVLDQVDLGHGQARTSCEVPDDAVIFGRVLLVYFDRVVHAKHHLVRIPVAEQIHARGDHERDHHAASAAR